MSLLKKKFGKFAVSIQKMAVLTGGCQERWTCVADNGNFLSTLGASSMTDFMQKNEAFGATCASNKATITNQDGTIEYECY